jgi:hypothetical protein
VGGRHKPNNVIPIFGNVVYRNPTIESSDCNFNCWRFGIGSADSGSQKLKSRNTVRKRFDDLYFFSQFVCYRMTPFCELGQKYDHQRWLTRFHGTYGGEYFEFVYTSFDMNTIKDVLSWLTAVGCACKMQYWLTFVSNSNQIEMLKFVRLDGSLFLLIDADWFLIDTFNKGNPMQWYSYAWDWLLHAKIAEVGIVCLFECWWKLCCGRLFTWLIFYGICLHQTVLIGFAYFCSESAVFKRNRLIPWFELIEIVIFDDAFDDSWSDIV